MDQKTKEKICIELQEGFKKAANIKFQMKKAAYEYQVQISGGVVKYEDILKELINDKHLNFANDPSLFEDILNKADEQDITKYLNGEINALTLLEKFEHFESLTEMSANFLMIEHLKPVNEKPGPKTKYNDLSEFVKASKIELVRRSIERFLSEYSDSKNEYVSTAIAHVLEEAKYLKGEPDFAPMVRFLYTYCGFTGNPREEVTDPKNRGKKRTTAFKKILADTIAVKSGANS